MAKAPKEFGQPKPKAPKYTGPPAPPKTPKVMSEASKGKPPSGFGLLVLLWLLKGKLF